MSISPRGNSALLAIAVLVLSSGGCGTHGILKPMTANLRAMANPNKPNANARIISEIVIGDSTKTSWVSSIDAASSGPYCFHGGVNDQQGVGVLGSGGSLVCFEPTDYWLAGVRALSPASPAPGCFVVAGRHDANGDGLSDRSDFALFTNSGELLDRLQVASDTSDVVLSGLAPLTDSTFIAVGREQRGTLRFPYIALFAVTPDRHVALRARTVLESQPGRWLDEVAVFPPAAGDDGLFLCALSISATEPAEVAGIRATLPDLSGASVEWHRQPVSGTGPNVGLYAITRIGDNVFVVGRTGDTRKQPAPASGGYWPSGLAASYTRGGDLRWLTVVNLSSYSDVFFGIAATPTAIYAVGHGSAVMGLANARDDEVFGYGLISVLDPNSGQVIKNLTLGQDTYESSFNSAAYVDGALTCVGWTARELAPGPYRAWMCRVDVTTPEALTATSAPGQADVPAPGRAMAPRGLHGTRETLGRSR